MSLFEAWLHANHAQILRAFVRDVRTLVSSESPDAVEIIAGIKTLLDEPAEPLEESRHANGTEGPGNP